MRNEPYWGNRRSWNDKPGSSLIPEWVTDPFIRPLAIRYSDRANLDWDVANDVLTESEANDLHVSALHWLETHPEVAK